jgi:hypothetical protein
MTKTLKFVSTVILFFCLFLTTKAVRSLINDHTQCQVDKDCYEPFNLDAEDLKALKHYGRQLVCENGLCRFISL